MYTIEIKHNVESAHRFFASTVSWKCRHIHGHSWLITLTLKTRSLDKQGMVVEFGQVKKLWRDWLDTHLDHAIMLHQDDPMITAIQSVEPQSRIFTLSGDPTTEQLAELLTLKAQECLSQLQLGDRVQVQQVHVQETQVNAASYRPDS